MPTIKLIPSSYSVSNTSGLGVTNPANMYTDIDSTTYATVSNKAWNQTEYHDYIKGFNFDSIPSNAIVSDFQIKVKASATNNKSATSSPALCNNTTTINGEASSKLTTTAQIITFSGVTATLETIKNYYGSNFSIRLSSAKSSIFSSASILVYGAEIEVTYTLPSENKKIYLKENGNWNEYSKVYIKENNSWVEKSMSEISSIFSTTANYVKSS